MRNEIKNVNYHLKKIEGLANTFEDIFNVTFSNGEKICFEYDINEETKCDSFKITKTKIINAAYSLSKIIKSKGNYIALNLDSSPNWIIYFWAILYSGNKPFLVNKRKPDSSIISACKSLQISYSVDLENNNYNLKSIPISQLNEIAPSDFKSSFANEIAISTSGTSLDEKICIYSGENIVNQIKNSKSILVKCSDIQKTYHKKAKFLVFLPFYHIFGLVTLVFWFSFFGYPLVFLKDYSPSTIIYTIKKHEVTHIMAVPLFYHQIEKELNKELSKLDIKTQKRFNRAINISNSLQSNFPLLGKLFYSHFLKMIREKIFGPSVVFTISGGSSLKDSALKLFNGLGYHLHVGYGSSEIGITSLETSQKPKIRNINSVGYPIKSIEYKIVDDILYVKGKSTCNKVIVNGKEELLSDWFNTLDVVKKIKNRYFILGRKSDLIILSNGENINPDQIEKLFNMPSVVTNYSIFQNSDGINLLIQLSRVATKKDISKIKEYVSSVIKDKLILNIKFTYDDILGNGIKVSRKLLTKKINDNLINIFNDIEIKKELDNLENEVLELTKEILNNNEIKLSTNFLTDIQINSLDYYLLIETVNEKYEISINKDEDNYCYSVEDIVKEIKKKIYEA